MVTLTLAMSEAVTVAGGTPTMSLNDGGTATYTSGSGSSALTFSYTVGAGQNTAALAATTVNLNAATITDGVGNAANLSLSGLVQTGPQIDTTVTPAPVITGDTVNADNSVALSGTAEANATVTVYDGSTELGTTTANPGGVWNYTTGVLNSGTQAITATATDAAGNTSAASNPVSSGAYSAAHDRELARRLDAAHHPQRHNCGSQWGRSMGGTVHWNYRRAGAQ